MMGICRKALAGWAFLTLAACGPSSTEADRHVVEGSSGLLSPQGEFDEESARADAVANVSALAFEDVGDTSQCTDDCSGHTAGFDWAKTNTDDGKSTCGGESQSFVEGCEAFASAVNKRVEEMRDEWSSGGT